MTLSQYYRHSQKREVFKRVQNPDLYLTKSLSNHSYSQVKIQKSALYILITCKQTHFVA